MENLTELSNQEWLRVFKEYHEALGRVVVFCPTCGKIYKAEYLGWQSDRTKIKIHHGMLCLCEGMQEV